MKLYISERQKKMPVNCDSKMEAKKKATKKNREYGRQNHVARVTFQEFFLFSPEFTEDTKISCTSSVKLLILSKLIHLTDNFE